jgi:DNA-directed RNA polymerase subunit M/transcription elongation factor TFIIS
MDEIDLPPRPRCPKCTMAMITASKTDTSMLLECLRCGHTESSRTEFAVPGEG